ncbi:E3 binding domain-containing protein [Rhodococcus sp. BGS-1C]|uniref:E3 binding domain-containing protein n=1 Tax=Rhodococcus sp. BGS-1C TaxID=2100132 RepID=UPI003DA1130B
MQVSEVEPYVTPLVRELAADNDVELSSLNGTGVGGRIRKQDVLAAVAERALELNPYITASRLVEPERSPHLRAPVFVAGSPSAPFEARFEPLAGRFVRDTYVMPSPPSAGPTPGPRPLVGRPPAPRPSAGPTPGPRPLVGRPPALRPSVGRPPAPRPSAGPTPAPRPSAGPTPAPRPSVGRPPAPRPSVERPPAPRPSVERPPAPRPSAGPTPVPPPHIPASELPVAMPMPTSHDCCCLSVQGSTASQRAHSSISAELRSVANSPIGSGVASGLIVYAVQLLVG